MYNLGGFRERIRSLYRVATLYDGRRPIQADLAHAIGLHPVELSKRLHGSPTARLTSRDAQAIVRQLAEWGAISTRAEARELLDMVGATPFSAAEWQAGALARLSYPQEIANPAPVTVLRHNLPEPTASFVGRRRETSRLKRTLASSRLVSVVGPGGIGKTTLTLQVGREVVSNYTDGVWFVSLAQLSDGELVPQQTARALGLSEQREVTATAQIIAYLRQRQLLLALDNCEHLLTDCARFVQQLLAACPHLRVLATSREPLGLRGETLVPLAPMSVPPANESDAATLKTFEAVRLFTHRAHAVNPNFKLGTKNAAAVVEIVRLLDGLPLALELAAARLGAIKASELATRLRDSFGLLALNSGAVAPRHHDLRQLFDWSYNLLDSEERTLFVMLAAFAGSFDLRAVEQVCQNAGIGGEVAGLLLELVRGSLVQASFEGELTRYRLLTIVRDYAAQRLREAGAEQMVRRAHAAYYLSLASKASDELQGGSQGYWLETLDREHDNFRAALGWSMDHEPVMALQLVGKLGQFWRMRGYLREGLNWLLTTLKLAEGAPDEVRLKALVSAGLVARQAADYPLACRLSDEGLVIARRLGDRTNEASLLNGLGSALWGLREIDAAGEAYNKSLTIMRELGNQRGIIANLANLANIAQERADIAEAERLNREAMIAVEANGDHYTLGMVLTNLGNIHEQKGDHAAALGFHRRSLELRKELGDRWSEANCYCNIGAAYLGQAAYPAAAEWFNKALALSRELGNSKVMLNTVEYAAQQAQEMGEWHIAVSLMATTHQERAQQNIRLSESDQATVDRVLAACRSPLGDAGYAKAWQEGARCTLDEAVVAAMEFCAGVG